MKRLTFFLLIVLSLMLLIYSTNASADREQAEDVKFRWSFGALVGPPDDRQLVSVTRDTVLKSGDEIKMLVEIESGCFVYIFHQNPKNEVRMLFPYSQHPFHYVMFTKYYIPEGDQWFELDENVGKERFYLMACKERLQKLEALYEKYRSTTDSALRKGLENDFIAEMREMRAKRERLTIAAESPILLGGTVRGTEGVRPDVEKIAVEISARDFYSRTFTIDHR